MMSRPFSGWVLNTIRPSIVLVGGGRCQYSQCRTPRPRRSWHRSGMPTCRCHPNVSYARPHSHMAEDLHFHLLPEQISYVLRANERSHTVPGTDGRSTVLKFESNILASNSPCEDRRSAATCLQTPGHMFGIFDGHAGATCAQSVSERLLYYIAVSMMSQETLQEIEFAAEHMKPVLPILQWHKHKKDYMYREMASLYVEHLRVYWQELLDLDNESGKSVADAMSYAFQRLDSDISLEAQVPTRNETVRNLTLQVAFSGATACVSHVDGVNVHVANAGDCRAVLGVQDKHGGWSAVPLTADHNACNTSEVQRVRSEHPASEEGAVVTDQRLLGILMPFRAFGDVQFKWSEELQRSILKNHRELEALNVYQYYPANYHTPPYLTAMPEITYHKLRGQDRFLVMASDGLWDTLDNQEVVRLVAEYLREVPERQVSGERRSLGYMQNVLLKRRRRRIGVQDHNVATHLIRHAVGRNEDGEIEQERLAAMLSLPEDLARMYRDDITVTVILFNTNAIEAHYRENEGE
ncbi:hypothetical protein GDO78_003333 [Eleutherodactylus coqui]|uniref:[Pyruvate dehydrogenase [acetyl-transferring]]-phosphatase 2, mitochondrial n=1 Tax=Eleutherodactylus coqui TaxID=57060 RepID=A0A8J6ES22_ELECQ|nr:hypothetical protein GDO78_003333 [Eleutherodactylus coqui]